jgi:CubicO group peptidase (beta-lactamase class C family)
MASAGKQRADSSKVLPIVEPERVGLSSERLKRISTSMQKHIDQNEVPGTVTMIGRHGAIAHFEAQGYMDIESKKPMQRDTIFRIASMTKPVTSLALMMLFEEGHFMLNDPISKFIPEYKNIEVMASGVSTRERQRAIGLGARLTVPAEREITFRDCLTHTAGFTSPGRTPIAFIGPYIEAMRGTGMIALIQPDLARIIGQAPVEPVAETVKKAARVPLIFQPGTEWNYGMGHDVAGVLVEIISGQSLDEFMRTRIFEPLGMEDTYFYVPQDKLPRLASLYRSTESSGWKIQLAGRNEDSPQVKGPKIRFAGGGGLLSTTSDYARFAQLLLNGGVLDSIRLLSRTTVELMTTNHTADLPISLMGPGYGFGLGLYVRTDPAEAMLGSPGTYGWGGAFATWYFADPKEDMFGLFMTQVGAMGRGLYLVYGLELERLALQAIQD